MKQKIRVVYDYSELLHGWEAVCFSPFDMRAYGRTWRAARRNLKKEIRTQRHLQKIQEKDRYIRV